MVLLSTFVKLKASTINSIYVLYSAAPIELLLPKVIALLKTSVVPVKVNAPALLIPVPFKVMPLVLPNISEERRVGNDARFVILVLVVLPNAVVAPKLNVPALMVVEPL